MTKISIEVQYALFDGSRKKKIIGSQCSNESLANFARNVKKEFAIGEQTELAAKVKLILIDTRRTSKFYCKDYVNDNIYEIST